MTPADAIDIVQPFFAARLQSLDFFSDIAIAAPRLWKEGEKLHTPKSITDRIDQALTGLLPTNGKIGAAVRVFQPTLQMKKTNGREAGLYLVCRCEVNPILNAGANGTNKNVSRIAYEVLRAGQGFTLMPGFCSLFADGECFIPYVSDDRKFATVDVLLQSNFGVSPLAMCVTPRLTQDANGLITLTNVTSGADIWYSTDLSVYPGPNVVEAVKYSAPFTVDGGTPVLWAAYQDEFAGSHVGYQMINY